MSCIWPYETKPHQFLTASKFFICTFHTFMISERVLLSSVVDIIVIIFHKRKLNRISVGDIEKKLREKKVEVIKNLANPLTLFEKKGEIGNKTISFTPYVLCYNLYSIALANRTRSLIGHQEFATVYSAIYHRRHDIMSDGACDWLT